MALNRENRDTAYLVGRLVAITEHYAGKHFGPNTISNMYQHPARHFEAFRRYIDPNDQYLVEIMDAGLQIPITAKNEIEKGTMALGYYAQRAEYDEDRNGAERQRIGQRIAELRKEKGLTQQDIADRTGIQRNHISRIEAGKYSVGFDTLQSIAEALGGRIDIITE